MRDVLVRLLALAVAVGMVVGALWLRGRADDGDVDVTGPDPTPTVDLSGDLRAVCTAEVAALCRGILSGSGVEVQVVAGIDEAEAALDAAEAGTVLVSVGPVPEMLADRARRAGGDPPTPVVVDVGWSSPVVVAVWEDRAAALDRHCGGELGWACVGDVAGRPWTDIGGDERWGPVAPGHADPASSTVGLLALAQGVAAEVGDVGFTLRDLQADGTRAWLTQLERAVPGRQDEADQLRRMLTQGRSAMDLGATLEAEAARTLPVAGTRGDDVVLRWLEPWLEARVVVAGGSEDLVGQVADQLGSRGDVASSEGWRVGAAPPEALADAPERPAEVAAPSAGALEALLQLQGEVVR